MTRRIVENSKRSVKPQHVLEQTEREERRRIINHFLDLWTVITNQPDPDPEGTLAAYEELLVEVETADLEDTLRRAWTKPEQVFRPTPGQIIASLDRDRRARRLFDAAPPHRVRAADAAYCCIDEGTLPKGNFACGCKRHAPWLWCRFEGCQQPSGYGQIYATKDNAEWCREHAPGRAVPNQPLHLFPDNKVAMPRKLD